jgi:uncharacterized RDD family membrane protein YckC
MIKSTVIDTKTRIASAVLDHVIMTFVTGTFAMPDIVYRFIYANNSHCNTEQNGKWLTFIAYIGYALYFCKDCFNGQSVAKRILKFQVVNGQTGQLANPLRCFVRDIFIILFPIEGIILLVNPSRRLGDRVAGTMLIPFDPDLKRPKLNYLQIIVSFLASYGIVFAVMLII